MTGATIMARLTDREIQQLHQSIQSRSVREVALTVCTIRSLSQEVRSIMRDLFGYENQSNGQMPPPSMIMGMPSTPMVPHSQSGINSFNQSGQSLRAPAYFQRRYRCNICGVGTLSRSGLTRHKAKRHNGATGRQSVRSENSSLDERIARDVSHQDGPDSISSHSDAPISPNEQSVGNAPSVEVNSSTHSDDVDGISQDPNIFLHGIHIKHEPTGEASIEQQADGNSNESVEDDIQMSQSLTETFQPSAMLSQVRSVMPDIPMENQFGALQCTECDFTTNLKATLRAHQLTHKDFLPFSCTMCTYKTNKKHVLMRHYSTHTGNKPHNCSICGFGTLDHCLLLAHMQKNHPGINPYTCTKCGEHFATGLLLKKHERAIHGSISRRKRSAVKKPSPVKSASSDSAPTMLPVSSAANMPVFPAMDITASSP